MGTDIHGRLQRRYSADEDYEDVGPIEDGRNYLLFACLAGVRNGFGFAGVKTHEPLVPISEPRGLPENMGMRWDDTTGDQVPIGSGDGDFGDHSYSWLTLREVVDWPGWEREVMLSGVVTAAEYARLKASGETPENYSGDSWGPNIVVVLAEQADAGVAHTHVRMQWPMPIRQHMDLFMAWLTYVDLKWGWLTRPRGDGTHDPAAVRMVFGFDS